MWFFIVEVECWVEVGGGVGGGFGRRGRMFLVVDGK